MIKKIFVYFLVIVIIVYISILQLSWYTMKHVVKAKLSGGTEHQLATIIPGAIVTLSQKIFLEGMYLKFGKQIADY